MVRSPVTVVPSKEVVVKVIWVVLDVEEVGGAQVAVAVRVAGVDRAEVDGRGGAGALERVAGGQGALELAELAADLADQVADGEADLGVARVDGPGAGDEVGLKRCRCHGSVLREVGLSRIG